MSTDRAKPLRILFSAPARAWPRYEAPLRAELARAGLVADLATDHPPGVVDYIIYAPGGPLPDFGTFTRAKAVLSLWAGVETILPDQTLTLPLARLVDPGLRQAMTEWVVAHVLRHHLGTDDHVLGQDGRWRRPAPPLATDRPVTVLGLGELGASAAGALAGLGFPVTGWSRTPRDLPGLARCLSGAEGLEQALASAQIVVTLLPLTPETENLLNARTLALMPEGAVVINPGRGGLIDDDALLAALDTGHLSHATLDVFRTEPLPPDHPFWAHPRVTVTPHIAAETIPTSAARSIAANIAGVEAGRPLAHQVDRARGY